MYIQMACSVPVSRFANHGLKHQLASLAISIHLGFSLICHNSTPVRTDIHAGAPGLPDACSIPSRR